jgi:hypothetical protein
MRLAVWLGSKLRLLMNAELLWVVSVDLCNSN